MEKVIEAEKFVLRDAAARVRAELAVQEDGSPRLVFLDENQRERVQLTVQSEEPRFVLLGETGVTRVNLTAGVGEAGSPSITLCDKEGKARVDLSLIDAIGGARLAFTDQHGETRAMFAVEVLEGEHRTALGVYDKDGRLRARKVCQLCPSAAATSRLVPG